MSVPQGRDHAAALAALDDRLRLGELSAREARLEAETTHRAALVELEERARAGGRANAVQHVGFAFLEAARAWHRLADVYESNPVPSFMAPGNYSQHDLGEVLRRCAIDVERLIEAALREVEP